MQQAEHNEQKRDEQNTTNENTMIMKHDEQKWDKQKCGNERKHINQQKRNEMRQM